ncbi:MAG: type IV pilus modification PilV family protein [Acidimicrobiales bacterium]
MGATCRAARDDAGLSIIEVVIAMSLIAVVLLGAEWGVIGSMSAASLSKEHSVATALASATMAQVVALPFPDLQSGLNPSAETLSTDPNISVSGSTYTLRLNGATIPTTNTNPSDPPLVPHSSTVTEGITYDISTYPTVSSSAPGLVTVVVVVSWKGPTGSSDRVVSEDAVSAP